MPDETARQELAVFEKPRLPWHPAIEDKFGIDKGQWRVLAEAIFPSAKTADSVVMALSYCAARNLDIFKRPVHIVPMWSSEKRAMVETVWPSISEIRTTAVRTGQYAGCDEAEFGPEATETFSGRVKRKDGWEDVNVTVTFPEWGRMVVYKIVRGQMCRFVGPKIHWKETKGCLGGSAVPNDMWSNRPYDQFEKCVEAAALRRAFPEEIGNELTAEEMYGQVLMHDVTPAAGDAPPPPKRSDYQPPETQGTKEGDEIDAGAAQESEDGDAGAEEPSEPTFALVDEYGEAQDSYTDPEEFTQAVVDYLNGMKVRDTLPAALEAFLEKNRDSLEALGEHRDSPLRQKINRTANAVRQHLSAHQQEDGTTPAGGDDAAAPGAGPAEDGKLV